MINQVRVVTITEKRKIANRLRLSIIQLALMMIAATQMTLIRCSLHSASSSTIRRSIKRNRISQMMTTLNMMMKMTIMITNTKDKFTIKINIRAVITDQGLEEETLNVTIIIIIITIIVATTDQIKSRKLTIDKKLKIRRKSTGDSIIQKCSCVLNHS